MKRLLITGIPGMGKTTLGNTLEAEYGFNHLDMESHPIEHSDLIQNTREFIDKLMLVPKDVVITWGFHTPHSTPYVLALKEAGFKLIWLDGNRDAAFRKYKDRVTRADPANIESHIDAFHKQIKRIEKTGVVMEIKPVMINTFTDNGEFRNGKEVLDEILL